jgi:hypothetical protein
MGTPSGKNLTGEQNIKFVVSPELSPQIYSNGAFVPNVGNSLVYQMAGANDRPYYTNTNNPKITYTPSIRPAFSYACGYNTNRMGDSSMLRQGATIKPLPSELGTSPGYIFGDVSVDSNIVQNPNNIVECWGPRGGISSRVLTKNLANIP